MINNKARVVQILLDKYILQSITNNEYFIEATARGTVKRKDSILVGDIVEYEKSYDKYVIQNVDKRKNQLIRPPVSNIDQLVIVLSIDKPAPDYILLDKELILCEIKNITPIICINKTDLSDQNEVLQNEIKYINNVYGSLGIKIINTSVKTEIGIEMLLDCLKQKISAFSGNSGVGKSSITKMLIKDKINDYIETNTVGNKTNRGKHTTKYVKLYEFQKDSYILDTPGFSSYELYDINYKDIRHCYFEFNKCKCDYEDCMHVNEDIKVCDVKRKVKSNILDKARYERYVYIYNKLKELDDKKYK